MAILKVARMGHPVLRARAQTIPPAQIGSPAVQRLIDDLFDTMREYSGIGLAAPQVHESVRIFVAGLSDAPVGDTIGDDEEDEMPFIALINPEITVLDEAIDEGWEGCLSIPDIRGKVPRALTIRVTGFDRTGARVSLTATGLPARVIQHECDHLDGVLFFDRMSSFETLTFMDEYQRFWSKHDDDEEEEESEDEE